MPPVMHHVPMLLINPILQIVQLATINARLVQAFLITVQHVKLTAPIGLIYLEAYASQAVLAQHMLMVLTKHANLVTQYV